MERETDRKTDVNTDIMENRQMERQIARQKEGKTERKPDRLEHLSSLVLTYLTYWIVKSFLLMNPFNISSFIEPHFIVLHFTILMIMCILYSIKWILIYCTILHYTYTSGLH